MTKLCPRGKAAAKRKFKVYPSAYANAYASKICAGKAKDPSGVRRKDWGPKKMKRGGGVDTTTSPSVEELARALAGKDKVTDADRARAKNRLMPGRSTPQAITSRKSIKDFMENRKKMKEKRGADRKVKANLREIVARKKDGGEIKINKVIKGLKKASKLHAAQAKTLETVKKADGGMIDMTKMKYV